MRVISSYDLLFLIGVDVFPGSTGYLWSLRPAWPDWRKKSDRPEIFGRLEEEPSMHPASNCLCRARIALIIIICAIVLGVLPCKGQESTGREEMEKARSALVQGKYDSSDIHYRKAAHEFQNTGPRDMYFKSLCGLADNLTRRTRFSEADSLTHFLEKEAIAELGSRTRTVAEIYGVIGYIKIFQDSCGKAIDYLSRGLEIWKEVSPGDETTFASFFYRLGLAYSRQGKPQEALSYLQKAKRIQEGESGDQSVGLANTLIAAAQVHEDTGDPETALHLFERASNLLDAHHPGSSPSAAFCYHSIAVAEKELGRYEESLAAEIRSLAIARNVYGSYHLSVASILAQIGDLYAISGDLDAALLQYDEAHTIFMTLLGPSHSSTKDIERREARLLLAQGRVDTAVHLYRRSMEALVRSYGKDNPQLAGLYKEVGDALITKGDIPGALGQYGEALRLSSGKGAVARAEVILRIGKAWLTAGEADSARQMIQKALVLQDSAELVNVDLKSATLRSLGDLLRRGGDLPGAVNAYRRASLLLTSKEEGTVYDATAPNPRPGYRRQYARLLVAQAEVLSLMTGGDREEKSRGKEILALYDRAGKILAKSREAYKSEDSKLTAQEEVQSVNAAGLSAALLQWHRTGNKEFLKTAFSFAERSRGAVLREAQLRERSARDGLKEKGHRTRDDSLRVAAERIHRRIEWVTRYGESGLLPELRNELIQAYNAIDALEDTLSRRESTDHAPGLTMRVASPEEISFKLIEKSGLIEYARGSDGLYVFVLTKESFNAFPLGETWQIDSAVIDLRRGLRTFEGRRFFASSRFLYSRLVAPLLRALHGLRDLTIVADGSLGLVPFETLVAGGNDPAHAHYLVRDYDIGYAMSATMFSEMQQRSAVPDSGGIAFAGFAPVFHSVRTDTAQRKYLARLDPKDTRSISVDGKTFSALPYSDLEVRWIAARFLSRGEKSLCELHDNATERCFKANAGHSRILHVATHGFIDPRNPDLSALLFSPAADTASANDGVLYASEVYNLRLNADLVVLSSCESGVGKSVAGEGILAMSRAFVYAGARNIAYSLWKVSDRQTRELMQKFYERVLRGESYVHALSGSKREMLKRRSTANPFSWAGFVLMSE
jgi:CHAT domain-containing protein